MNAPVKSATPDAAGEFRVVLIESLFPSPTQPRTHFDDEALNELAESIKAVGVMQPLVVRKVIAPQPTVRPAASWPFPTPSSYTQPEMLYAERITAGQAEMPKEGDDGFTPGVKAALKEIEKNKSKPEAFEIIAGERRWRASKLAELKQVPVIIRQYTDEQVLQAHLIENLQREDLHPLEEAEGYQRLMKTKDENGNFHTADTIAAKIGKKGKSRNYVYGRLTLLKLCPEARQAFYDGKLDASRALLIARIPVHKLQVQVLKKATEFNEFYQREQLSYRQVRDLIQSEYMLDLADAPFDIKDAELIPKCGSCTDCTKRTGNQPELFDDVDGKDVCTDPVCHAMKKTAHVLALQKKYESQGSKLVVGKDAKKIIPNNYMQSVDDCLMDHGLVKLDAKVPGDEKGRTYAQVMKEAKLLDTKGGTPAVAKTVIENPRDNSKLIETVNIEAATKALREAGFEITLKGKASPQKADDKHAKALEKGRQELAIENAFRSRLFDTLHAQIEADMLDPNSGTFPVLYRMVAMKLWNDLDWYDEDDMVTLMRKYTALPNKDGSDIDWDLHIEEFGKNIPNLTPAQHLMLIIELPLLVDEITTKHANNDAATMLELAEELDIDADAMKKEVSDEVKAEQKAKAAADKKAAALEAACKPLNNAFESAKQTVIMVSKARPKASWPFPTPGDQTK